MTTPPTSYPTNWFKGRVKGVPSGDSLLIRGTTNEPGNDLTPLPEKVLTLASLMAPKLARKDGKDEPFAWPSREFLRQKCIGKAITFRAEYNVANIPGREFGSVLLMETDDGEQLANGVNVAFEVVAEGWAKVRTQSGQSHEMSSAYLQEVEQRQAKAQEQGLGMWNKTPGAGEATIRDLPPSAIGDQSNFDALTFLDENKGKPLEALVDTVRDGSTVRVYLLPSMQFVQVYVAGIQSPAMARRPPGADFQQAADAVAKPSNGDVHTSVNGESAKPSVPVPLTAAQKLAGVGAAAPSIEIPSDPIAVMAKTFTELKVLHRNVRVVLEGVDKYRNLIGSVHYVDKVKIDKNRTKDIAADLGLQLVQLGLARVIEWSASMMDDEPRRVLKAAELTAKKDRLLLWTNYVPPVSNSTAIHNVNFTGKVIEVVSGDCIVVADDAVPSGTANAERRVNLSSIRAPKVGNPRRDEKPAPYSREAKEFLRSRLIGQQVNVNMEYSRKISPSDGPSAVQAAPSADARMMDFGSVFLLTTKGEARQTPDQPQGINVAEMVVMRGLANVVKHREFEERSNYYDALMAAESKASKAKKGIYSGVATPAAHISDLSVPGSTSKAKNFFPFLSKQSRIPGVVEYVLSGHRFKIVIPKETCAIAFSLSGVRCPGRGEAFSEEAIAFMRQRLMQRDVEINVETVDKTGTFLGSLWESKSNVSVALLEAGLAKLHPRFNAEWTTDGHSLVEAEQVAKKQQKKVWEGYVEGQETPEEKSVIGIPSDPKSKDEVMEVKVTEVLGGGKFYAQTVNDARIAGIMQQLSAFKLKDKPLPPGSFTPQKGDLVLAHYDADDSWNRALVTTSAKLPITGDSMFEIFYIDYGNQTWVPLSRLRPVEGSLATSAPQGLAQLFSLQHIKVPELEDEHGEEAAELLGFNIGGRVLVAHVGEKDTSGGKVKGQGTGPRFIVTLVDKEKKISFNSLMVENGLAKVEKKGRRDSAERKAALDSLYEIQDVAKKDRLYIWQYGDADSDDEDVLPSHGRGAGGRR